MPVILQTKPQETLKSVREKSQKWILSETAKLAVRVDKIKSLCGYSKIQPQIFGRGLSTLGNTLNTNEECYNYNQAYTKPCFLVAPSESTKPRRFSFDNRFQCDITDETSDFQNERQCNSLPYFLDCDTEETNGTKDENAEIEPLLEILTEPVETIQVVTPNKKKRNTKIVITNDDQSNPKILPGVLLTYNKDYTNLSQSNGNIFVEKKKVNGIAFRKRSDSMHSIDL